MRLKLPAISWLAALVRGQAAVAPADVGGRNLPTLALLPDEPLRLARADGAADQQSRVQAFIGLPEARGRHRQVGARADGELLQIGDVMAMRQQSRP